MKIALGTDHAGFQYKEKIKAYLKEMGHEPHDFGTYSEEATDYPLYIRPVAEAVARGEYERGIILGGSGNGEAMVANRVAGIRCALCWNVETALLARKHNDANMLSLGARMVSLEEALEIVRAWLTTPFDGGRHLRRIKQIDQETPEAPATRARTEADQSTRTGPDYGVNQGSPLRSKSDDYEVFISLRYLKYSEEKGSVEFQIDPGLKGPSIIYVPSPEEWSSKMPDWAQGRREEILSRISSKCKHLSHEFHEDGPSS